MKPGRAADRHTDLEIKSCHRKSLKTVRNFAAQSIYLYLLFCFYLEVSRDQVSYNTRYQQPCKQSKMQSTRHDDDSNSRNTVISRRSALFRKKRNVLRGRQEEENFHSSSLVADFEFHYGAMQWSVVRLTEPISLSETGA